MPGVEGVFVRVVRLTDTGFMSLINSKERKRIFLLFGCSVVSVALLWGVGRYNASKNRNSDPFRFPTRELAQLDRDLQARFAVVPDKDFGIERTYGYQHYLYNPRSQRERATISALKQKKTEAAFYLMSRALWLRSWDGYGYKPIQGPVHLTGKITLPLPRAINFIPRGPDFKVKGAIVDQDQGVGPDEQHGGIPTHNPDGTPVSSPTPPRGAPSFNALQKIGNEIFEMAEDAPRTAKIGLSQRVNERWHVVAVPIRASQPACLPCHVYNPYASNSNTSSRLKLKVGDALGVAFYLYNVAETRKAPSQTMRDALANSTP